MIFFKDIWRVTCLSYYYIVLIVMILTTDAHQLLFLASREARITIYRYIHQANVFRVAHWTMYTCMHVNFRILSFNKCAWSCTFMHIHTMNMHIHRPIKWKFGGLKISWHPVYVRMGIRYMNVHDAAHSCKFVFWMCMEVQLQHIRPTNVYVRFRKHRR